MTAAQTHGSLWGARARDYANLVEAGFSPLFEAVFDATGVQTGTATLDVGCGPGLASHIAAERGATVAGLDAAETSIRIASERTPAGEFRVGDMECLPWEDGAFDVVTGFNAFTFASDPILALREARRVTNERGRVAMASWGRETDCRLAVVMAPIFDFFPPRPPGSGGPYDLAEPGRIESMMRQARLEPYARDEVMCTLHFADLDTAIQGVMSAGIVVSAVQIAGEQAVHDALAQSLAPFQTARGNVSIRNVLVYVAATR